MNIWTGLRVHLTDIENNMKNDNNQNNSAFSKDTFQALKGYLAVCVLIHHVHQFNGLLADTSLNYPLLLLGHWAVVLFMFMSGFGLYESYKTKGREYIKKFPRNRILTFFIMYVFFVVIYTIYELATGGKITPLLMLETFTYGNTVISFGWYLQLSLLLYIIFFLAFIIPSKKWIHSLLLALFAIAFLTINIIIARPYNVYVIVVSFLFGIIVSLHKNKIEVVIKKYSVLVLIVSLIAFCAFTLIQTLMVYRKNDLIETQLLVRTFFILITSVADISLAIVMISFVAFVSRFAKAIVINPASKFLGNYSLEIYALQGIVLRTVFSDAFKLNPVVASLISVALIVIIAIPIHLLLSRINKAVKK